MIDMIPRGDKQILYAIWPVLAILLGALVVAFVISRIRKAQGKKQGNFVWIASWLLLISSLGIFAYHSNVLGIKNLWAKQQVASQKKVVKKQAQKSVERLAVEKMVMRDQDTQDAFTKIGFVAIPDVSILLPIYNDAYSVTGLNLGADYANKSADDPDGEKEPVMGQGNYGLAAHNFNDGKTGFSALQEKLDENAPYLVDGQTGTSDWLKNKPVYLANADGIYEYRITEQTTMVPTDVAVLNQTPNAQLTIISCLFPNINYRIITHADFVKHYSWQSAPKQMVGYFNLQVQNTNARADWFNPGTEEGANGDRGGAK